MDELGTWAQVLYPNVAGFGSQKFLQLRDDELKLVCVRAYNDFLRDWASADTRRLLTIMTMPFWDIDEAVAEIERNVDKGHRGILFTGEPHRFGLRTLAPDIVTEDHDRALRLAEPPGNRLDGLLTRRSRRLPCRARRSTRPPRPTSSCRIPLGSRSD